MAWPWLALFAFVRVVVPAVAGSAEGLAIAARLRGSLRAPATGEEAASAVAPGVLPVLAAAAHAAEPAAESGRASTAVVEETNAAVSLPEETAARTATVGPAAAQEQPSASSAARSANDSNNMLENLTSSASATALAPVMASCGSTEACLQIVDAFFERQPHSVSPVGMLQTYGVSPLGGGGPCGELCNLRPSCVADQCRYDPYDNAVAAIYFARRGNLDASQQILDALTSLMYPGGTRQLQLVYSSYRIDGSVLEWSVDTGNNAWVGMAFANYAAASGKACYAAIAREIMGSLSDQAGCADALGGFMGRLPRGAGKFRATEHNIDMYALGRMLGNAQVQEAAHRFVSSMYGAAQRQPQAYATGTEAGVVCDTRVDGGGPVPADAQFWNILAEADNDTDRKTASLEFALRPREYGGLVETDTDVLGDGAWLAGIRFSDEGHGAQWENTAAVVMGVGMYNGMHGEQAAWKEDGDYMESAIRHMLGEYGAVLATVRGGNYQAWLHGNHDSMFPGGSDTGMGWTYLRYEHSAATAWAGLMLLQANPFAPPPTPVPTTTGLDPTCIAPR